MKILVFSYFKPMKNAFILVLSILFSGMVASQQAILIDRNEKTESIFDENDPYSLISILKLNANYLGNYELSGIHKEDLSVLTSAERANLYGFSGPQSDIPMIDNDPNSENFGENKIVIDEVTGSMCFIYPNPDSIFIDLTNISRIRIGWSEGEGDLAGQFELIELWKLYGEHWIRVFGANANDILKFEGFSMLKPVDAVLESELCNASDPTSMWSVMRANSLERMEASDAQRKQEKIRVHDSNYMQTFLPSKWDWTSAIAIPHFRQMNKEINRSSPWRSEIEDGINDPLSMSLGDSLVLDSLNRGSIFAHFEKAHFIYVQDPNPLMDYNLESARYGQLMLREINGQYYKLYEPSEICIYWMDYTPDLFIRHVVSYDSTNNCKAVRSALFFSSANPTGKPYVVSNLSLNPEDHELNPFLLSYFDHFSDYSLWDIPNFATLKKEMDNKKNRFDFNASKKDRKRFYRRTDKLLNQLQH